MSLKFNNTEIKEVKFNGTDVVYINYNGTRVWSKERTVTVTNGTYIKSTTGAGSYVLNTQCTLTATPNDKDATYIYSFDGWYVNGTKVSSSATYTFEVTEDITIEARGTRRARQVVVVSDGSLTGQTRFAVSSFSKGGHSEQSSSEIASAAEYASITVDVTNATKFVASCSKSYSGSAWVRDDHMTFNGSNYSSGQTIDVSGMTGYKTLSIGVYCGGYGYASADAHIYSVTMWE